jgi:hyperosmotically inducible protein
MNAPRLMILAVTASLAGAACNRTDTAADTEQVREQAREVAVEAGDRLADGWLATKIQAQFFADNDIRARDISVTADDGVVTLRGRVPDENAHTQAVQTARNTDGVLQLNDQITIGPPADTGDAPSGAVATTGAVLDDGRITSTIQSKFFLDDRVKGRRIDVDTRDGIVTLRGQVASEEERAQALSLARATDGVQRVEDALSVNPSAGAAAPDATIGQQLDDAAVTTKIQAKFFLDRDIKQGGMDVTTKDGVVLLDGTVPSQEAKDRALTIVRDTDGVVQVIDRLRVAAP